MFPKERERERERVRERADFSWYDVCIEDTLMHRFSEGK